VVFGLVGLSLFQCQIIIEFEYEAFQYLIVIVPIMVLFLSFLVCDYVIDFEKKKVNEPWIFLMAVSAFVFFYLLFVENPILVNKTENYNLIFPIVLFLLYYLFILVLLNYLEYRSYKAYQKLLKEKTENNKKDMKINNPNNENNIKIKNSKNKSDNNHTSSYDEPYQSNSEYFGWVLLFYSMGFIFIIFIMSEIVMMKIIRTVGFIILIFIPIILIIYYFRNLPFESKEDDGDHKSELDQTISIDDLEFKPPSRGLIWLLFIGLILIGFYTIIYYAILEQLSNIMVQVFILMIWIVIFYGFYNLGIPRGGADTKALMAMVILFPIYPIIQNLTIDNPFFSLLTRIEVTGYIFPFAFTILINAAFIMLFFILILLIYNTAHHNFKFPHAFIGYSLPIREVPKKFVWLMELVRDGKRKFQPFPVSDSELKTELKQFKKLGIKEVWVTPKIPFIIPITIGLILAVIFGNIIFLIIGGIL
jgi:preflagellin peptidase FlaK